MRSRIDAYPDRQRSFEFEELILPPEDSNVAEGFTTDPSIQIIYFLIENSAGVKSIRAGFAPLGPSIGNRRFTKKAVGNDSLRRKYVSTRSHQRPQNLYGKCETFVSLL